ncbi:MAG: thioredoxin family protein [Phaeodactylibacter sp.]|nr:thioredoxin family protein [Phaeodactylibacter sp.]MCB9303681.1 thioredoxin family protein [Lewinellaceae bacterium]
MAIFNDSVRSQLTDILREMKDEVNIAFFTQEFECNSCNDAHTFVEEFAGLSDKVSFEVFELVKDKAVAEQYGVDKIPAIVLLDKDKKDYGIRFYGIPGGYEINSFLTALKEVSGNHEEIPAELANRIKAIDKDIHIQVFVTATCPYCPGAVVTGHRLALENPHIKADMVDASVYPELSMKYRVMGVPKIIINEDHELVGNQPVTEFLKVIENLN